MQYLAYINIFPLCVNGQQVVFMEEILENINKHPSVVYLGKIFKGNRFYNIKTKSDILPDSIYVTNFCQNGKKKYAEVLYDNAQWELDIHMFYNNYL